MKVHELHEGGLSVLPDTVIKDIRKQIKTLLADETAVWKNALELTNAAFKQSGVDIPTPEMVDVWGQYEDMLALSVKSLSSKYGREGDWRMSITI